MTAATGLARADLALLQQQYERDGFVAVRQLIDPAELAALASTVIDAVGRRKAHDTRSLDEKSRYEQSFVQCQYLWEDNPAIRPLTFHQAVCGMAAALMHAPAVRLWHDQALFKEPGGKPTQAHQDHPYWPIAEDRTITAWIPLIPVDRTTGCMGYVPGSHREAPQFVDIFAGDDSAGPQIESKAVFVPAEPGDVLFHHGRTMHMAMPNASDHMRRAYTAIYFADGCTRGGDRPHPSVDRDGIAVGKVIDGAATPIAWPLPQGRFPEPGPWPNLDNERTRRALELGIIPSRG
ncbi:phytanoyl-CoA dioxygenase family protein [Hephaestia sp. GCM10023244]|uniref:phytanoyl-CoA dioxygenase family protein n=1 Tax=unclassified Hephaestia TaxID=2631281 RepID=UPI00207756B8|nr:phytanoyl-CoA dioxygenase family protein [Hephaestia sp. MAHUQ-44]MCM8729359.1 phytanoyl-CoA dioxygenase family protein [Hephaestia sp. MAHUQ-44]